MLATIAAFERGADWLDELLAYLDGNRRLLRRAARRSAFPTSATCTPEAGYLAWLDCRALGLGDDPAAAFLERGRVALSRARRSASRARVRAAELRHLPALLAEAVERMAAAL